MKYDKEIIVDIIIIVLEELVKEFVISYEKDNELI